MADALHIQHPNYDLLLAHIVNLQQLLDSHSISYPPLAIKDTAKVTSTPLDLSVERIEILVDEFYTTDVYMNGLRGIVYFIKKYVIVDEDTGDITYQCTNNSRRVFTYIDMAQASQTDTRCKILLDTVYPILVRAANKIYHRLLDEIYKNEPQRCDSSSDSSDYDSDIEETIAQELATTKFNKNKSRESDTQSDTQLDAVVKIFLEIKSAFKTGRKKIVDELVQY